MWFNFLKLMGSVWPYFPQRSPAQISMLSPLISFVSQPFGAPLLTVFIPGKSQLGWKFSVYLRLIRNVSRLHGHTFGKVFCCVIIMDVLLRTSSRVICSELDWEIQILGLSITVKRTLSSTHSPNCEIGRLVRIGLRYELLCWCLRSAERILQQTTWIHPS